MQAQTIEQRRVAKVGDAEPGPKRAPCQAVADAGRIAEGADVPVGQDKVGLGRRKPRDLPGPLERVAMDRKRLAGQVAGNGMKLAIEGKATFGNAV